MKKTILSLCIILSTIFLISACGTPKDPECSYRGRGLINEMAVFPDSVALGDNIVAQFKVTGRDGCSQFDGFIEEFKGEPLMPYRVSVPSPQITGVGCVCTEIAPIFDATYTYLPTDTGLYYFSYLYRGDIIQYDSVYVY